MAPAHLVAQMLGPARVGHRHQVIALQSLAQAGFQVTLTYALQDFVQVSDAAPGPQQGVVADKDAIGIIGDLGRDRPVAGSRACHGDHELEHLLQEQHTMHQLRMAGRDWRHRRDAYARMVKFHRRRAAKRHGHKFDCQTRVRQQPRLVLYGRRSIDGRR